MNPVPPGCLGSPPTDSSNHLPLFTWPNSSTLTVITPFSKKGVACSSRMQVSTWGYKGLSPKTINRINTVCNKQPWWVSSCFPYIQYNTAVMLTDRTKLRCTLRWGQVTLCSSFTRPSSASNRMGPVTEYMVFAERDWGNYQDSCWIRYVLNVSYLLICSKSTHCV
jgi:hypothetical protein